MINYSCDLCDKQCNGREFALPIAATWIGTEPCDIMPVKMNLCQKCKSEIYKSIEKLASKKNTQRLGKQALDIKMNR